MTLPCSFVVCNTFLLQRFHQLAKGRSAKLPPVQKNRLKRFVISGLAATVTLNLINFACCISASVYNGRMFGPCSHRQPSLLTLLLQIPGVPRQQWQLLRHRPQPPTEIKLRFQKGGGPSSSLSSHRAFRHLCAVLHTRCLVPSAHPCR